MPGKVGQEENKINAKLKEKENTRKVLTLLCISIFREKFIAELCL